MNNTVEKRFFKFPEVKWLHLTGEADKSVRYSRQLFSRFNIPKIIRVGFNGVIQKIKSWTFFFWNTLLRSSRLTVRRFFGSPCGWDDTVIHRRAMLLNLLSRSRQTDASGQLINGATTQRHSPPYRSYAPKLDVLLT